jgi:hypothetical protein
LSLTKIRSIGKLFGGAGFLCVILSGCGVNGEEFQPRTPPAEKSVIYIYRPYKILGSGATPIVTCGSETIEMEPGGFYSFAQEIGTVTCTTTQSGSSNATPGLKFDTRPGEQYFIKEDVNSGTPLTLVKASVGSDEIKDCRRQGIKH